ncbi:unnamed protein product [Camellia sinensis]
MSFEIIFWVFEGGGWDGGGGVGDEIGWVGWEAAGAKDAAEDAGKTLGSRIVGLGHV